jgi:hypothetical protein
MQRAEFVLGNKHFEGFAMIKPSAFLLLLALLSTACTFSMEILTPEPPTLIPATQTEVAISPTPTETATAIPISPTPTQEPPPPPLFSNARFTIDPATGPYQTSFPGWTKRVYAVWDYQDMRPGMIVRWDWYYKGALWLTYEEPWDFAKYGVNGTVADISIYDLNNGLESGDYHFESFIDSRPQPIGDGITWPSFKVAKSRLIAEVTSPNGRWLAFVEDPTKLSITDPDQKTREIFSGREILNPAWLPDNKHIIFVDRDRSQQTGVGNMGILDDLWIVNVKTGESKLLFKGNAVFLKQLVVSPEGQYIAGVEGSGSVDACAVDSRLVIFELSVDLQSVTRHDQADFARIPTIQDVVIYPTDVGQWQNSTRLKVPLDFSCATDSTLKGYYLFNMTTLRVEKAN